MLLDIYSAVGKYFYENWTQCELIDENNPRGKDNSLDKDEWVKVTFLPITNQPDTIGPTGFDRFDCFLIADIYTELNIGDGRSIELASDVFDIFNRRTVIKTDEDRTIYFSAGEPRNGRIDSVLSMYRMPIYLPFYSLDMR